MFLFLPSANNKWENDGADKNWERIPLSFLFFCLVQIFVGSSFFILPIKYWSKGLQQSSNACKLQYTSMFPWCFLLFYYPNKAFFLLWAFTMLSITVRGITKKRKSNPSKAKVLHLPLRPHHGNTMKADKKCLWRMSLWTERKRNLGHNNSFFFSQKNNVTLMDKYKVGSQSIVPRALADALFMIDVS